MPFLAPAVDPLRPPSFPPNRCAGAGAGGMFSPRRGSGSRIGRWPSPRLKACICGAAQARSIQLVERSAPRRAHIRAGGMANGQRLLARKAWHIQVRSCGGRGPLAAPGEAAQPGATQSQHPDALWQNGSSHSLTGAGFLREHGAEAVVAGAARGRAAWATDRSEQNRSAMSQPIPAFLRSGNRLHLELKWECYWKKSGFPSAWIARIEDRSWSGFNCSVATVSR